MAVMETEDKLANARAQGQAQFESIREMVATYHAASDDDVYEAMTKDLATDAGYSVAEDPDQPDSYLWRHKDGRGSDISYSGEEEAWGAACDDNGLRPDEDDARRAIEEDALSVQVRSGWYSPGDVCDRTQVIPEEFKILLCTGGPACRLIGRLSQGEPTDVRIEVQDWFTPWTDMMPVDKDGRVISGWHDTLLDYCRVFYFGD